MECNFTIEPPGKEVSYPQPIHYVANALPAVPTAVHKPPIHHAAYQFTWLYNL
jgi:hypothetical protein